MSIRVDRGGAKAIDAKERQLSADRDAYKRLRHDGIQPRQVGGSAVLEGHVNDQWDVNLGRIVPREERSRVEEGAAMAKEMYPA